MKKNTVMRIASFLLVAVLLSTCAISGTYAKYTSQITTSDSARVAKWDFKVNGVTANSNTFEFDLFKTILDTKDGAAEGDIAPNDGTIIAPGTKGDFSIKLKNDSEVTAEYKIDYTVTNSNNVPIVFSLDGTTWKKSINSLDVSTAVRMDIGAEQTITVYWMWDFEGNDTVDTNLGLAGTAEIIVQAVVTVDQVN